MPVIGRDITLQEAQEQYPHMMLKAFAVVHPSKVKYETKLIPTWLIHPSRILENEFNKEVIESSRRDTISNNSTPLYL